MKAEYSKKSDELEKQKEEIKAKENNINTIVSDRVLEQINAEKIKIYKEAKASIEKEQDLKIALLEEQLKSKEEKLEKATLTEIELRKEKIKLDSDKKEFELEKMRQLDADRAVIVEESRQKVTEEYQYKIAQLNKQLQDSIKVKDELARKLEQGSQQAQGEILEVALEELLKAEFTNDEICPVPKGISGADVIQKVNDKFGRYCGQIVWESKRTKNWSEAWIQKLKDDQRAIKADIAVIISTSLPNDVKGFAFREGIWICDVKYVSAIATALRMNLEAIAREKAMSVGKNEKIESLYSYLSGIEFKQRVEAIVEAFTSMDSGLKKERMAYERIWAEREKQIKKIMTNTIGMYGDLNGLVTLQQINTLEIE
ncbi:MAG: DUF2130 domain-containing protein [Silvanigrellaceae bacterium]|nr:DUF2130 domain-containing protein [Silvanigrellaceae bacterium]